MISTIIFAVISGMIISYISYKSDKDCDPEMCGVDGMLCGVGLGIIKMFAGWAGILFLLVGIALLILMWAPPVIIEVIKERKGKKNV